MRRLRAFLPQVFRHDSFGIECLKKKQYLKEDSERKEKKRVFSFLQFDGAVRKKYNGCSTKTVFFPSEHYSFSRSLTEQKHRTCRALTGMQIGWMKLFLRGLDFLKSFFYKGFTTLQKVWGIYSVRSPRRQHCATVTSAHKQDTVKYLGHCGLQGPEGVGGCWKKSFKKGFGLFSATHAVHCHVQDTMDQLTKTM